MRKTILTAIAAAATLFAHADSDVLMITLNDGTVQTIAVDNIKKMNFETAVTDSADSFTGDWNGIMSVSVGGMFTYTAEGTTVKVSKCADGTLTVTLPAFSLSGTVMGDITMGEYRVAGLTLADGIYTRDYGSDGLTMHFTSVQNGATTMDKDYSFNAGSTISVAEVGGKVRVTNRFTIGSMPFEITETLEASSD